VIKPSMSSLTRLFKTSLVPLRCACRSTIQPHSQKL